MMMRVVRNEEKQLSHQMKLTRNVFVLIIDDDMEEEEIEEESEEEDDEPAPKGAKKIKGLKMPPGGGKPGEQPAECKQQ